MKLLLFLPVVLLTACGKGTVPGVPDVEPVGEGLKVIGFAIVAAAVLGVIGKLFR